MSGPKSPVVNSDGEYFTSIAMAAHSIVAKYGCGQFRTTETNIKHALCGRQRTAYGLEWRKLDKCVGCKYAGMVGVCPIKWNWPKYPASVCKLKGGAQ